MTWTTGNQVTLLENGDEFFPRVLEAIGNARREILLETFILCDDPIGGKVQKALIAAANRGVWVSLVVDGYGTYYLPRRFIEEMTTAGIHFHIYHAPPRWLRVRANVFRRLHRKLLVADGLVGFIGGINFGYEHLSESGPDFKQDYAVELRGPVVTEIRRFVQEAFQAYTKRDIQFVELADGTPPEARPGGTKVRFLTRDNDNHRTDIEAQYIQRIRKATHHIAIANAYFFPGYRLLKGLRDAARRGVKVRLMVQGRPDSPWAKIASRFLYDFLVESEVEVYEYLERQFHGKIAAIDDDWATIGSSNLDPLSFALNLEANIFVKDHDFNTLIHARIDDLIEHSSVRRINQSWLRRRTLLKGSAIFLMYHLLRHFPGLTKWLPRLETRSPGLLLSARPHRHDSDDGV